MLKKYSEEGVFAHSHLELKAYR